MPWDDLSSTVDTNGYDLALGYVTDLVDQGYVGLNFTAQTYPGVSKFNHCPRSSPQPRSDSPSTSWPRRRR